MRIRPEFGLAVLLLAACSDEVRPPLGTSSDRQEGPPMHGGWLHAASFADVRSLDAAVAFDEASNIIEQLLYAKLVDYAPDGKTLVPDLAESWTVSEDGLRYVFELRPHALFHDGSEVTADDVKRSIERALAPDTPNPASSFYERIRGYAAFTSKKAPHLDGVKVEGERTIAIELSEPDATLLAVLALPTVAPVCKSAGSSYDRDFATHPCGAGPYRLAAWEQGKSLRLERFDGYYRPELPYLDGIEWSFSVPTYNQRFKFESGEIDYVRELSETDLFRYLASPSWNGRGEWDEGKAVHSVFLNTSMPPFDDRALRRAVSFAIDPREVSLVRPHLTQPATHVLPPSVPGYDPSPRWVHDPARALAEMQKAGHPFDPSTGKGGLPGTIPYYTVTDSFDLEAALVVQQQLARIGVRIQMRPMGYPAYLAVTGRRGAAQMGADGWSADFLDPSDFFEPLFHSRAIADEDSQNRAFYRNPEVDRLLDEARRERSFERRVALYRRAEEIILDDAPWVMLYRSRAFELWQPYVHGYHVNPALTAHLGFAWIDEGARKRALAGNGAFPFSRDAYAALLDRVRTRGGRR